MSRPNQADAAATKQRILEIACDLLSEKGAAGFSSREVARRAGLSIGMVNHYFDSKANLVEACIDTVYEELAELGLELQQSMVAGEPLESLIERAVLVGFAYVRKHASLIRVLVATVIDDDLAEPRRERTEHPLLAVGATHLASRLGLSPSEVRLRLKTLVLVTARYGITRDESLAKLVAKGDAASAIELVEDHLVSIARLMLVNA